MSLLDCNIEDIDINSIIHEKLKFHLTYQFPITGYIVHNIVTHDRELERINLKYAIASWDDIIKEIEKHDLNDLHLYMKISDWVIYVWIIHKNIDIPSNLGLFPVLHLAGRITSLEDILNDFS